MVTITKLIWMVRKVKTPNGSVLNVKSKSLALAVANEWRVQNQVIRPSENAFDDIGKYGN